MSDLTIQGAANPADHYHQPLGLRSYLEPHCDPTVCLYDDRIVCVKGDEVVDIWPIDARGRRYAI